VLKGSSLALFLVGHRWVAMGALAGIAVSAGDLAGQTPVAVFAAASLTDAFTELGRRFEATHGGARVRFNFAGSQQLALQILQGARADVFASADGRWMTAVAERGLLLEDPVTFARNRLVVILPRSNPGSIRRLEDLARVGVKLVIAAEAVPVGRYTREALGRLGAASGFGPGYEVRVLRNVVSHEDNVKGVVAKVQLGEADAGVAYRSDVTGAAQRKLLTLEIPDSLNPVAAYPLAVLKGGEGEALARAFVALVLSREGQEVLARWGLLPAGRGEGAGRP
jgi:molybdate transport system substrate-binding protein